LKELKSKGGKVPIDKHNEVLGANIFAGNIGGIVDSVNTIIKDGVTPNNTTVRLLNYFFGKTDNFVKGEAVIEKVENLHNIPKKLTADLNAALPAGSNGGIFVAPAQSAKFGQVLNLTDANASDFVGVFGAWHTAQASKSPADKAALKKSVAETLKKTFAGDVGTQLAAKLGVEVVPKSAAEGGKWKDPAVATRVQARAKAVLSKLKKSKDTISAVGKFLGSQPFDAGVVQVNFAELVSVQRVFQNTHGELKKYIQGVRTVALANLILHGAPNLPEGHPFPALYLSKRLDAKHYDSLAAQQKGSGKVSFLDPRTTAANAVKPILENHERWFADYYVSNDDLKTY